MRRALSLLWREPASERDDRGVQTLSMSERAANHALLGGISSVLEALDVISAIVLAIIALIVSNTFAMNARARRGEYAVLRVLGFEPRQIRRLLMLEALCVAGLGYGAGVALAFPVVQIGIGRWLEENAGKFFPKFVLTPHALMAALSLSLLAAAVAAWLPAASAVREPIRDALQKRLWLRAADPRAGTTGSRAARSRPARTRACVGRARS